MKRGIAVVDAPASPSVRHGGPDAAGVPAFDFSTNGNAAGPLPSVARAVAEADRTRYPDPDYRALRERLATWHGVEAARVVIAGSASEFIHRFTRVAARERGTLRTMLPSPGYGEYAAAAAVAGLMTTGWRADLDRPVGRDGVAPIPCEARPRRETSAGDLCWFAEPMSPTGRTLGCALATKVARVVDAGAIAVLDLAYQPLRFDGRRLAPEAEQAWQLWSPNKACGMTGVRAAYAIAPRGEEPLAEALRAHAPSWITGAEGVAMLAAFAAPAAQAELALHLPRLRAWRDALADALRGAGWQVHDAASVTPFFVARAPAGLDLAALRARGIKLRATGDMGLPGWLRLSAQPPAAVQALLAACGAQAEERTR